MAQVVDLLGWLALAAYAGLALLALREWGRRRVRAAAWAAAAFGTLALALLVTRMLPADPGFLLERLVGRSAVAAVVLFPFFLYRFSASFRPPSRGAERLLTRLTYVVVAWTYLAPPFPDPGEPYSLGQAAYLAAFLTHWAALSAVVAFRLWRAGEGQPSLARRRMRLFAVAAALLTLGIFVSAAGSTPESAVRGVARGIGIAGAVCFLLALAPPWIVRVAWRRPEQERVRQAIGELMRATSEEEVAQRVLRPMVEVVGARGAALFAADGRLVGVEGLDAATAERLAAGGADAATGEPERVAFEGGLVLLWTSPYAPYFGEDEVSLLRSLGELTGLALDRSRLFAQEREARAALERADEIKSNFIALAAHELRTPVAAVHGVAETLHARGAELAEEQRVELRRMLLAQSTRLRLLVEQLLDLSRLEADAITIDPRPLPVRERVEEVVAFAADEPETVVVAIPGDLEAPLDPAAFDRILTNLVVNAHRYGAPPIRVSAELRDRHFRLTVEDRGPGVPPELVPDLFERFTRGDAARAGGIGTGLGLAIARSYAQAHRGDLLYEPAEPHGARFQLVLPVEPDEAEAHVLARSRPPKVSA